jgi:cellulose synthase/poly-beta-1,6-N-acetylglucosamine synthase-like glycosyltransferase
VDIVGVELTIDGWASIVLLGGVMCTVVILTTCHQHKSHKKRHLSHKNSNLYRTIIAVWAVLVATMIATTYHNVLKAAETSLLGGLMAGFSLLFITYFWLNGTKDIIYPLWYHLILKRKLGKAGTKAQRSRDWQPRVLMTYCTHNDFNGRALAHCLKQTYDGDLKVEIFDDSTQPRYKRLVNDFAKKHHLTVRRRDDRHGFKAGNINTHTLGRDDYDFLVLLDSDERVPQDFISNSLKFFRQKDLRMARTTPPQNPKIGIVQANHIATHSTNPFQERFAIGVDSHWPVYQGMKNRYGFLSFLGHGAMTSRQCFESTGGFPLIVAEDIGYTILAREVGFLAIFDHDTTCEEEFPIDYQAFRKRHLRWTGGNMEFIRRFTPVIMRSKQLSWYEKLDIVLFTYALPLTCVFFSFVLINIIGLPLLGVNYLYEPWMIVPTVIFLIAPMINDVIYHWQRFAKRTLAAYSLMAMMLYGGMLWTSLKQSVNGLFADAIFHTTPKQTAEKLTFANALNATRGEWALAIVLVIISVNFTTTAWPVVLIAIPAMMSTYLAVYHQK